MRPEARRPRLRGHDEPEKERRGEHGDDAVEAHGGVDVERRKDGEEDGALRRALPRKPDLPHRRSRERNRETRQQREYPGDRENALAGHPHEKVVDQHGKRGMGPRVRSERFLYTVEGAQPHAPVDHAERLMVVVHPGPRQGRAKTLTHTALTEVPQDDQPEGDPPHVERVETARRLEGEPEDDQEGDDERDTRNVEIRTFEDGDREVVCGLVVAARDHDRVVDDREERDDGQKHKRVPCERPLVALGPGPRDHEHQRADRKEDPSQRGATSIATARRPSRRRTA
jgi:hypothetical protein